MELNDLILLGACSLLAGKLRTGVTRNQWVLPDERPSQDDIKMAIKVAKEVWDEICNS